MGVYPDGQATFTCNIDEDDDDARVRIKIAKG